MKFDKNKVVFLLGGHDLEMQEIRTVLDSENIKTIDRDLSWSKAKLKPYQTDLTSDGEKHFYAVELNIDEEKDTLYQTYKEHITIIDHHGRYIDREASLLQVLELLGKEPTRKQQLIAANDARYIDGMKCIGATEEEIRDIRQRDRAVQGVTDSDEKTAQGDVKSREVIEITENDKISIVSTTIDKFSAIVDALYFDFEKSERTNKLIVYNDKTIVLYEFDLTFMKRIAKEFGLFDGDYYYGGSNTGYFGITKDAYSKLDVNKFKDRVIQKSKLYSSHMFMFPFRFDYAENGLVDANDNIEFEYEFYYGNEKENIDSRLDLTKLDKRLISDNWIYSQFVISGEERHLLYNDFGYFYDYARDALYNHKKSFSKDAISNFYIKKPDLYEGKFYTIDVFAKGCGSNRKDAKSYQLEIEEITLRVFQTGVAILAIELNNYSYSDKEDILRINDYGRRIYPQFIGEDREFTAKMHFLANYIQIGDDDKEYFNQFTYKDIEIGKHIKRVLGKNTFTDKKTDTDKFYIQPSLDDRMYVLSWYGNDDFVNTLKSNNAYKCSDDWYRYIFVDNDDATVQNDDMKVQLLREATYARWSKWGTLFGVSRYSFVALTDSGTFGKYVINRHMKSMYFQMATLLLANRTSILRFSDEVAALNSPSSEIIKEITLQVHREKIEKVYDIYSTYNSRLYFKEVTHQDQGIELYTKGMRQMSIYEHHDKLDNKFTRLFDYTAMLASQASTDAMNRLSILGAIFLPASFLLSIFGLGIFDYNKSTDVFDWWIFSAIVIAVVMPMFVISFSRPIKKMMHEYWIQLFFLLFMVVFLVSFVYAKYLNDVSTEQGKDKAVQQKVAPKQTIKPKTKTKAVDKKTKKEERNVTKS